MSELLTCDLCGYELCEDTAVFFDEHTLCDDCFGDRSITCDCCGERIWNEGDFGNDSISLCERCYDHHYTRCESCDCLLHNDEVYYDDEYPYLDYKSHKTTTCGLHIHVNRTTFGETREIQDERISRVLYFVEHHWEELLKFSRRSEYTMNRWAARYGYKNTPKEILEHAKKGCNGRYSCINLQNWDTVEFRMFRGTLKVNTIIATLELVDLICQYALTFDDEEISKVSWTEFVEGIDEEFYPELIIYLKERRLYINEPIETIEEE